MITDSQASAEASHSDEGRRRRSRFVLFGLGGLLLLAAFDLLLLYQFNLDVLRYGTDHLGWTEARLEASFESGRIHCRWCGPDGWVVQNRTAEPGSFEISGDFPQRDANQSLRIRAEKDWDWNTKPRIELSSHAQPFFKIGEEYWVGWSIFLPDDGSYQFDTGQPEVLLQVHGLNDSCDAGGMGPPHALRPINGRWRWDVRWDPTRCMSSTPLGREVIDIGPQELGRWTDFVARFVFSHEDDGVTQVWLDGNLVVDRVGMPNHYNSAKGPYLKLGFYKSGWLQSPSDVVSRTIYLDAIRVYEGSDGYAQVDPANAVSYGNGTTRKLISIVVAGLLAVALVVFAERRARRRRGRGRPSKPVASARTTRNHRGDRSHG